jgi:hypothetical protein
VRMTKAQIPSFINERRNVYSWHSSDLLLTRGPWEDETSLVTHEEEGTQGCRRQAVRYPDMVGLVQWLTGQGGT